MIGLGIAAVCILGLIAVLLIWIGWAVTWGNVERHQDAENTGQHLNGLRYKVANVDDYLCKMTGILPYVSSADAKLGRMESMIQRAFMPPEPPKPVKKEPPLTASDLANVRMVLDKTER